MHGQFVWYELTTPDVDAAQKFYPRFTGWGIQPFDKDYTMWTNGGTPIAGMFRLTDQMRQQGVSPNWMPYVETSNVDDTAAKAASLGGRVMVGPQDIPNAGRFAVLQDPQGATFGVLKPGNPGGAWDGTAVVGRFSWHELMTTDYVQAFQFYRDLFGWEKTGEMDMGGGQNYFMYGKGDKAYGGMFNRFGDMASMQPFWLVYIHVRDVGKAVDAASKGGGVVQRPQMDIPGGSIAILGDPQGAGFALHHANAPAAAAKTTAKKAAKAVKKAVKAVKKAVKKAATKVTKAAKKATKPAARTKTKAKARAGAKAKPNAKKKTKATAKRGASSRGRKAARKR
jgi:predicted enzyme related to lactoylglutathione lyase